MNTTNPAQANTKIQDKLKLIYDHPGPYVSVYVSGRGPVKNDVWHELDAELEKQQAPSKARESIQAALQNLHSDLQSIAVISASDGINLVDYGFEPLTGNLVMVETLPYVAPLLEWNQHKVPHLVVVVEDEDYDIITFFRDGSTKLDTRPEGISDLIANVSTQANEIEAKLVVLSGEAPLLEEVSNRLIPTLPLACRVITDSNDTTSDQLADATVRYVTDMCARKTMDLIEEQEFLSAHDAATQGLQNTLNALDEGGAEVLLIHDEPDDCRRLWIASLPHRVSVAQREGYNISARAADVLIASAIMQNLLIRIIPSVAHIQDNVAVSTKVTSSRPG
jgi:hypothetical protein